MTDYKNKRGIPDPAEIAAIKPSTANAKSAFPPMNKPAPITTGPQKSSTQAAADEAFELDDDDDDDDDGWGKDNFNDLKKFDYNNTDLNKLGDYQLNRHKQNMERDFAKHVLKPGDKGFEYDKRVDFSSQMLNQNAEASWDEDADDFNGDEDDYFDDDFAWESLKCALTDILYTESLSPGSLGIYSTQI